MRHAQWALAAAILGVALSPGCSDTANRNEDAPKQAFDPDTQYPAWAYDAPFYYRPARDHGDVGEEIPPVRPGDPTHYYVRSHTLYLPRPEQEPDERSPMPELGPRSSQADLEPRIEVYQTETGGIEWYRVGCFGLGQTHFACQVDCDGVYGFRFVGPGLPPAKCTPPRPQKVYHVDTLKPETVVYVEPNQAVYPVGQTVTIHWSARDDALADNPVSIAACWESTDLSKARWHELLNDQRADGSTTFVVPPDAVDREILIRAAGRDRAGNLGVGFSVPMPVTDEPPATPPAAEPTKDLDEPEATTQPGLKPGLIQVGLAGQDDQDAAALRPMAIEGQIRPDMTTTGEPGTIVPMGVMSLLGEAELTGYAQPALSAIRELRAPTIFSFGDLENESPGPNDRPMLILPPIQARPTESNPHWASRPWQRLAAPNPAPRLGIWGLPDKVPIGLLRTDRDTPEAEALGG